MLERDRNTEGVVRGERHELEGAREGLRRGHASWKVLALASLLYAISMFAPFLREDGAYKVHELTGQALWISLFRVAFTGPPAQDEEERAVEFRALCLTAANAAFLVSPILFWFTRKRRTFCIAHASMLLVGYAYLLFWALIIDKKLSVEFGWGGVLYFLAYPLLAIGLAMRGLALVPLKPGKVEPDVPTKFRRHGL